ncbi:MAG: SH3 domain-containing protein [Coprococcus sp.]
MQLTPKIQTLHRTHRIHRAYRKKTEEDTEEDTGYVTCSVLNVRRASSEKSDKVGTLKRGEEVKILRDEENGWYAIDFEGHIRYVHGDYITTDQNEVNGYTASDWDGPVLTAFAGTITGPSGKETYYNLNMSGRRQHYEKSWQYR